MSLYGSGIYGISTYGDSKSIAYNIGFTAHTIDYRTVNLSWDVTAVNDSDIVYAWKIIKTVGGVPDYPNQGQLVTSFVDGGPYAGKKIIDGKYTDVDAVFPSSSIITYSFWGLIGVNSTVATWKLLGAADAVIVDNDSDDTTLRILRLLPGAWTSNAAEALGEPDTGTQLYNFVGAFAFYYDKLRAQAGAINNLSDYRKYPKELLPSAVVALGFTYEPKLGDSFHRSLYKNGHLINSLKGTYLGLNNYIKSLTHFKSMISAGRNMMLDYLQSSFEGSVGTWAKVGTSGFTAGSRAINSITSPTLGLSGSYLSDGYGILTKNAITISSLTTDASIVSGTIVDGTTWTVTTATAHGFVVGDSGAISGVHPTQFNTTFTVASVISSTKFTVTSGIDEYSTITATHTAGAAIATITFPSAHGLVSTDQITISGASLPAQFLNTFAVTYVNTTQVTIPIATGTAAITNVAGVAKCLITVASANATIGNPFILSYGSSSVDDTTTKTFLVTPGTPYLFSGWALIKSGSTSTITVQAQIQWFDAVGNLLSSATAGSTVNPTAWTKFESSSTYAAIFAPTKAMYAGIKIVTTNMLATDSLYLDNFMFSVYPGFIGNKEFGSGDAIYEDAKNINISLEGYRTNLISNPGFEDSVGFWNAVNGTLLSDTSPITALMAGSTNVCNFTSTASGASSIYTQWIRNLKPGKEYTFSAYVLAPANGITATANIEWDMPQSLENQTTIIVSTVSGYEGKYRPTVSTKVSSSETIVNNSSWTRISVTGTAPEFTKINGFSSAMVSIEFTASAGSEVWYLDCALFEESPTVNTYFQGNGGIIPSSTLAPGGSLAPIITDDLIPVGDTAWETRARSNFLYNPGFETNSTANWFIDPTSGTIDSFAVGTSSPAPKFGTYRGAVTAATTATYKIGTTFRYPSKVATTTLAAFPQGGERVTGSAYIAHSTNFPLLVTVSLTENSSGKITSNSFTLPASSSSTVSSWYRVHVTGVLDEPTGLFPSGTLSLSFTPQGAGGTVTYIDGAQVELGNYPTNYVNVETNTVALGAGISTISNAVTAVSKYTLYSNTFDVSGANTNTTLGTPANVTRATSSSAYYTSGQSLSLSATTTSAVTIPVQAAASPYWSTVVAGRSYTAWGHFSFSSGTAVSNIQAVLNWYDSSGTLLSSSSGTATNRPAVSTVTGVGTTGSPTITGTSGAFSSVVVGDGVSKAGFIPEGTYVTATTLTSITLSQNVTTGWASAGVRTWTVPTVTATAPAGAVYATLSFTYTVGASTTVLFLDSVVLRDDSRTQYTTNLIHGLALGDKVTINSISPTGYNATATEILSIDGTNTFTLLNAGVPTNRWTAPTVPSYSYVVITNAGTQYATNSILSSVGRSYYWPNIDLKYSRLLNTVANYLPIGSTHTLTKGVPASQKDENISSIVPSYSFENNLYGWSGLTNNTISRYASAGSKSAVKGFTSASWLTAANTTGTGTIGAQTEFHVSPGTLYQFAANIYAPTSATATTRTGTPKIQITWYTDSTKATAIGSTVDVTAEVSSRNAENRWAVLLGQIVAPISSGGAYYAVMSISYTPSSFSGTTSDNIVYIDDVVCVPL